ncbi:MAG TPA: hypothetical protein VES19_16840 [Candidatus Limnocylindrales bacterium]|nr:hypothetical protein [Candidatus Limnocylindrales bacterium]
MDVLLTIGMLGLMVAAIAVLGRTWPRSSRVGGYRAGRGLGAATGAGAGPDAEASDPPPHVPEEDGSPWRWPGGPDTPG